MTKNTDNHLPDGTICPVMLGITGHRDIRPSARESVQAQTEAFLDVLHGKYGPQLRVVTGMAEGADQLLCHLALARGIPVIALLPMERKAFAQTLDNMTEDEFNALLGQPGIEQVIELPPVTTSGMGDDQDVLQYEQLGIVLCRFCHIMIALWDGLDPEPMQARFGRMREKRGGTAHVVSMRLNGEYAEVPQSTFNGSLLFSERLPRLELARSGPLLHVMTPRCNETQVPPGSENATWHFQPGETKKKKPVPTSPLTIPLQTREGRQLLLAHLPGNLGRLVEVEREVRSMWQRRAAECETSLGYLDLREDTAAKDVFEYPKAFYAGADIISSQMQKNLLGTWSPGMPLSKLTSRAMPLGALFIFSISLPLASLFFETYCEYGKNMYALLGYILVLAFSASFYIWIVRKKNWQNNYQDFRALAEALRVQLYWSGSGIPLNIADNYLLFQEETLGWIRQSLRGAAMYCIGNALKIRKSQPPLHKANLSSDPVSMFIDSQCDYFEKSSKINAKASRTIKFWAVGSLGASFLCAVLLFFFQLLHAGHRPEIGPEWLHEVPAILIGFLPAFAGYFIFVGETRAYDDTEEAYSRALEVFKCASQQAEQINEKLSQLPEDQTDDTLHARTLLREDWNDLVVALGKESLAENGVWLQTHRTKKVEFKMGG